MYQQFVFSKGTRQRMLILLQQAMGQQWSTTVQLSYLKKTKNKTKQNKKVISDYGSTKNDPKVISDPQQNKVVFCCGFIVLIRLSSTENNSFKRLLRLLIMLHVASFFGNSPLSVYSFSGDHSHLCVIIVYCDNKYSLLLGSRTHARKLCELTTLLKCCIKMTKQTKPTFYDCFLIVGINCSVS